MDIVFLIYGLSFLALGLAIVVRYTHESKLKLSKIIWLLSAFGFSHGLLEWTDLWRVVRGDPAWLTMARPLLLLVSYGFLFEFGRRLVTISLPLTPDCVVYRRLLGRWLYVLLLCGIASGVALSDNPTLALNIWSRYLTGLPASWLAGIGFYLHYHAQKIQSASTREQNRLRTASYIAGTAFLAYGFFGGLVVPRADWFPASWINQESFQTTFLLPVQLLRGACAVVIALAVISLLKVFHLEWVERLRSSEKRFHDMAENVQDAMIEIDADGRISFWNQAATELFGYTTGEALGQALHDLIVPERFRAAFHQAFQHFVLTGEGTMVGHVVEVIGLCQDGREVLVEMTLGSMPGLNGHRAIGILRDISEKRLKLNSQAITYALDGILVTDQNARIQLVNPAFCRITGYNPEDVIGQNPSILRSGHHPEAFYAEMWQALRVGGQWKGEIWNRRRDGEIYPEWLSISSIRDSRGQITNYVGIFSDISRRKEVEQELEHLAFFDALTGLPNRILLRERLRQALKEAKRQGDRIAILYLDLDLFKQVNDQHGHAIGDLLLIEAGKRMLETLRETDTVARLGGDEFAIVLPHVAEAGMVSALAGKIVSRLAEPFMLKGRHCQIGTSIGIALYPDHGSELDTLINQADAAMYVAKRRGRNQFRYTN